MPGPESVSWIRDRCDSNNQADLAADSGVPAGPIIALQWQFDRVLNTGAQRYLPAGLLVLGEEFLFRSAVKTTGHIHEILHRQSLAGGQTNG